MQSSIYLVIAFVALSTANQMQPLLKNVNEQASSSSSLESPYKRYVTQEVVFYLTPNEIRALQVSRSTENKDFSGQIKNEQQNYNNEDQEKAWAQYFRSLKVGGSREEKQEVFSQNIKPVVENVASQEVMNINKSDGGEQNNTKQQQESKNRREQQTKESDNNTELPIKQEEEISHKALQQQWNRILNHNRAQLKGLSTTNKDKQKSDISKEEDGIRPAFQCQSVAKQEQNDKEQEQEAKNEQEQQRQESISSNVESAEKQGEGQLQQNWNRMLYHQRAQLKGIYAISNENQKPHVSKEGEGERSVIQQQSAPRQEQMDSYHEKEIDNILREIYNIEKLGKTDEAERYNQQRSSAVYHKEFRVINHHVVPVVKKVKIPVPHPVLIPVPEPYAVRVPHPYPVPSEVVKHIPVPVLRYK